ncbi:MAG: hypothetical protein HC860_17845 [Alkalinema sp. RU_4_3]|nr:hypothetical protein [Alkalinema sp. RU_4_3]
MDEPIGDFSRQDPEMGWAIHGHVRKFPLDRAPNAEELNQTGFYIIVGEGTTAGFEESRTVNHAGQNTKFIGVRDSSRMGGKEDIDHPFFAEDG